LEAEGVSPVSPKEDTGWLRRNARTCPNSLALIARRVLEEDWTLAAAALAADVESAVRNALALNATAKIIGPWRAGTHHCP
jgi:hypothetical protein